MGRLCASIAVLAMLPITLVTTSAAATTTNAQVKSKALALSDMPAGWSVDNSSSGDVNNVGGCLAGLQALKKKPPKGLARAEVKYTDGQLPSLLETVEAGKGSVGRYNKLLGILNKCKSLSYTTGGVHVTGSVGAISFPRIGDSSHAFAMNLQAEGESAGVDLVLFRVGEYDGDLLYFDLTPDPSTVQAFVREAVNKIQGKPATPPTTF